MDGCRLKIYKLVKRICLIGKTLHASCFLIFAYAWNSFPFPRSSFTHLCWKFDFNARAIKYFKQHLQVKRNAYLLYK